MRIERLSDRSGELLESSEQERRRTTQEQQRADERLHEAEARYGQAYRRKSFWQRLLHVESEEEAAARRDHRTAAEEHRRAYNRNRDVRRRVYQQAGGTRGEHDLPTYLGRHLGDEWTLLAGYRNGRGVADAVLIGPGGVWSIEIKHWNARIDVDGDDWRYQQLDRRGAVIRSGRGTDRQGRSWGRQTREVAAALEQWLRRNRHDVEVRSAIVFVHLMSELGQVRRPGVDLVTAEPRELLDAVTSMPVSIEHAACGDIIRLVRRDHRFHERRRSSAGRERGRR